MLPERLEWLTTTQIAALKLPALPETRQGCDALADSAGWNEPEKEGVWWRRRADRGGGIEFRWVVLPEPARLKLALDYGAVEPEDDPEQTTRREAWAWFGRLSGRKQDVARARERALQLWDTLMRGGVANRPAAQLTSHELKVSLASLYRWRELIAGVEPLDWQPALAQRHTGRSGKTDITEEAWQVFLADYLRPEKPDLTGCYRRLRTLAAAHGWRIPSERTLARRIEDMPPAAVTLAREGREALEKLYPAQRRDRGQLRALEAINLDGHKWDVAVRWPDGRIERPQMLAVQDLYSGAMLAWRVDRTLHKGLVRLAIGDVVEQWGVPDHCYMDNGRENAAKSITGGVPNRYRFKVLNEDPLGLLPQLKIETHWTTPYHGQSKPIERAFREFAHGIAKHPAFAGAYMGHKPDAKPENYGARAVPLDVFLRVVGREIAAHNQRPGRLTAVCAGKLSFADALEASLKLWPVRRASVEQRRLWLMAAEAVRVNRTDGSVELEGNRYWSDKLHAFRGERIVVRFDPDALHDDAHLYTTTGDYIGAAECVAPVGFQDVEAARRHAQAKRSWMRATREAMQAERRMGIAAVADMLDKIEPEPEPERPQAKLIRPIFGATARKLDEDEVSEGERLILQFGAMARARRLAGEGGND